MRGDSDRSRPRDRRWGRGGSRILSGCTRVTVPVGLVAALFVVLLLVDGAANVPPFVWIGKVGPTSFTVHIDVLTVEDTFLSASASKAIAEAQRANEARTEEKPDPKHPDLVVALDPALQDVVDVFKALPGMFPAPHESIAVYNAKRLRPGTLHYFGFGGLDSSRADSRVLVGSVWTFPSREDADVVVGLGSCQKSTERSSALQRLARLSSSSSNETAAFMLHLGDLHYADISKDRVDQFYRATTRVVRNHGANRLFSSMPVSYMYDDHDYSSNNGDGSSRSKNACMANYRRAVPRHSSVGATPTRLDSSHFADDAPTYHAFTVASVRFIITDLRSEALPNKTAIMSETQLEWFKAELDAASNFSVLVWASSRPWIGPNNPAKDHWGSYAEQRRDIADHIARRGISNLILVSGDAHMLAADNGTNSDYSTAGLPAAGFPVLQAAPLANFGSAKGGPYTEGCVATRLAYNYQYAILRLHRLQKPEGPCISFKGYSVGSDHSLLEFEKCGTLGGVEGTPGGGQGPKCSIRALPTSHLVGYIVSAVALAAATAGLLYIMFRRRK